MRRDAELGRLPKRAESSQSPLHWNVLHLGQRTVRLSADLVGVGVGVGVGVRVRVRASIRVRVRVRTRVRVRVREVECRPAESCRRLVHVEAQRAC